VPFDDEDETRVSCPACGGDTRRECQFCEGAGSVTAARSAAWRFERAARIAHGSGEHRIDVPRKDKPE